MIINLKLLESGKQEYIEYSNSFAPDEIPFEDTDLNFADDFCIEYLVEKAGNDYCLRGRYETTVKFNCDKCLAEFKHKINEEFTLILMNEPEEDFDEDDNIIIINNVDDKIDITDNIRENLLLALPFSNKCSDDCKGLCPECGINLNFQSCSCEKEFVNAAFNNILQNFKD